jgi:hypothetical protein
MILECIQWRRTVEDVGIEELYRTIDPFDVRSAPSLLPSFFPCVFRSVSDPRRSLLPHSFPDGGVSLSAGQWVSIRYAPRLALPKCPHATPNDPYLTPLYIFQTDKVTSLRFLPICLYLTSLSDLSMIPSCTARASHTHPELRCDKLQAALSAHNFPRTLAHCPRQYRSCPRRSLPSRVRRRRSADTPSAHHRRSKGLRTLPVLGLQVYRAPLFPRLSELLPRNVRPLFYRTTSLPLRLTNTVPIPPFILS